MSCFILTANNINAKTINGLTIFKIDLLQLTQASASLFDSEWLMGVVFEDINNNAIQDNNEPGIAGVRLFTVTGIQIQTDGNGRFHIPLDYSKSSKAKKLTFTVITPRSISVVVQNGLISRSTTRVMSCSSTQPL